MEVKIISKECIKPSSVTPLHLKTHKLSYLDQFMVATTYVPLVLFYPLVGVEVEDHDHEKENEERSKLLKQSLAQTLSRFYPLAGKIKDNLSIDCNDEGVCYIESRVEGNLLDFLSQPDVSLLVKFLPADAPIYGSTHSFVGSHVAYIQVNVFDCGGIAVGAYVTHMVADGVGLSNFLKCWGDIARGCPGQNPDFITGPSLFPQNDAFPKASNIGALIYPFCKISKYVTKSFVFDSSALAALKVKATGPLVHNPTRIEVVSALLWKCAMLAFRGNSGIQRPCLLSHTVNLRKRPEPPFSECAMGNFVTLVVAECQGEIEIKTELGELVHMISEAKTKIKSGFLKADHGDKGFSSYCDALKELGGIFSSAGSSGKGADYLGFTSWVSFGLYKVDFGWGKPTWVTSTGTNREEALPRVNFVILKETRQGNGIEAWVTLDEQDMAILECNEELLEFASLDRSPLHVSNA